MRNVLTKLATGAVAVILTAGICAADGHDEDNRANGCSALPNFAALRSALVQAVADETNGLNNHM
ncbi:MAG TPA: hypothetical protein VGF59_13950 [Bryobacteraceae bacterium]